MNHQLNDRACVSKAELERADGGVVDAEMGRLGSMSRRMMCSVMMGVVSLGSSLAMAQEQLRPPTTKEDPTSPKILVILIAVLLTGAVVFAASLKSKRTHQD
ncbi:MAG: hypothetical protein ACWA5W_08695 [Phycisphaerales bacterium]